MIKVFKNIIKVVLSYYCVRVSIIYLISVKNSYKSLYDEWKNEVKDSEITVFHGSKTNKWYSILRNGLRVMSKSKYESCGHAHGEGIYTSTNSGTARAYANGSPSIIAECTVLPHSQLTHKTGDYVLVKDPSLIRIQRLHVK